MENGEDRFSAGADRPPRQGWDAAFEEMARNGDDALVDTGAVLSAGWDWAEWEW
jgi:hypothetical protein